MAKFTIQPKSVIMKFSISKNIAVLLFATAMTISCNNKTETEAGIESDIENSPTSQDSVEPDMQTGAKSDTATLKNVDASRMSNGKDSVKGEVTPPNANEQ